MDIEDADWWVIRLVSIFMFVSLFGGGIAFAVAMAQASGDWRWAIPGSLFALAVVCLRFWRQVRDWWTAPRICDCHGCMPVEVNRSRSIRVSHGMVMWVRDGKLHYRHKSRIVDL